MGLSRALLGGVATGFLRANNDRRDRMTERMQALATDTAGQARERAKTALSTSQKNAQEENDKVTSLRSEGAIDDKGMYKDEWWLRQSQSDWKTYGEPSGQSHKEYTDNVFKAGKPKSFERQYKSSAEINQAHTELQSSITSNLQNDLNKPAATALDRFLGTSLRKMTGTPQEPVETPSTLPTFDPMNPQGSPLESYSGTGEVPDAAKEESSRSQLRSINLYTANGIDAKTYMQDKTTGEILNENTGEYMRIPEGMNTIDSTRNPFTDFYTDEKTGEELKRNIIETYPGDPLATIKIGGKTYVATGYVWVMLIYNLRKKVSLSNRQIMQRDTLQWVEFLACQ
jgi:hypothetical protein